MREKQTDILHILGRDTQRGCIFLQLIAKNPDVLVMFEKVIPGILK